MRKISERPGADCSPQTIFETLTEPGAEQLGAILASGPALVADLSDLTPEERDTALGIGHKITGRDGGAVTEEDLEKLSREELAIVRKLVVSRIAKATFETLTEPGAEQLGAILARLNNKEQPERWSAELRRLLIAWQQSGPNLTAMLAADPKLGRELKTEVGALYVPSNTGGAYVLRSYHGDPRDPNATARAFFMIITTSREWQKVGGPCPRCENFFIRKTKKPSIYCSPTCASHVTAAAATKKSREEKHRRKLESIKIAVKEWEGLRARGRTKNGWKEFVVAYELGQEITSRFLTRAVNNSEIQPPSAKGEQRNANKSK